VASVRRCRLADRTTCCVGACCTVAPGRDDGVAIDGACWLAGLRVLNDALPAERLKDFPQPHPTFQSPQDVEFTICETA
jgi:hypothetical protein